MWGAVWGKKSKETKQKCRADQESSVVVTAKWQPESQSLKDGFITLIIII